MFNTPEASLQLMVIFINFVIWFYRLT